MNADQLQETWSSAEKGGDASKEDDISDADSSDEEEQAFEDSLHKTSDVETGVRFVYPPDDETVPAARVQSAPRVREAPISFNVSVGKWYCHKCCKYLPSAWCPRPRLQLSGGQLSGRLEEPGVGSERVLPPVQNIWHGCVLDIPGQRHERVDHKGADANVGGNMG